MCPICSTNLRTAAPSAATHTQVAAVYNPPRPGPAGPPLPAGGFQAAAAPLAGDQVSWDAPEHAPAPRTPPAAPQRVTPGAGAATVEQLLAEAGAPELDSRPRGKGPKAPPEKGRGKGRRDRKGRTELKGEQLREHTMRTGIYLIAAVAAIGWVASFVRRESTTELFKDVNFVGFVAMGVALFMVMKASRAASRTRERVGTGEAGRLSRVMMGGVVLWMVPAIGAFLAEPLGWVYQSTSMHPIYYALMAAGVLLVINGLSGMKERGTYFSLYQFASWSVVLSTLPMGLPIIGDLMASASWWSSTFIMIGLGYIFMAYSVRSMRQGQYSQLDEVLASADRAFEARRFDEAQRLYSQGITLTHSLYSDAVFTARNPRGRSPVGGPSVPDEYFRPWIGKAKCLALSGKLRKALAIYELMLEVDPDLPEVWVDRGRLLLVEKRHAEAYISFDRAVKLDPASADARHHLSETLDIIRRRHA